MTEDEAKTKWCPVTAGATTGAGAVAARCIASACMAWRALEAPSEPVRHTDGSLTYAKPGRGYCGLAGQP